MQSVVHCSVWLRRATRGCGTQRLTVLHVQSHVDLCTCDGRATRTVTFRETTASWKLFVRGYRASRPPRNLLYVSLSLLADSMMQEFAFVTIPRNFFHPSIINCIYIYRRDEKKNGQVREIIFRRFEVFNLLKELRLRSSLIFTVDKLYIRTNNVRHKMNLSFFRELIL